MLCKYLPFYSFSPGRVVDFRTVQASDFVFQLSRHSLEILPPYSTLWIIIIIARHMRKHTRTLSLARAFVRTGHLCSIFFVFDDIKKEGGGKVVGWWYERNGRLFFFFTWEGTSRYGPRVDGSKKRERNLAVWKEEEEEVLISTKITTEECLSCPACDGLPKTIGQRLISWIVVGAISPPALPTYKGERKQDSKSDSVQLLLAQSWLFILGPWNYSTVDREDFMFTSFLYIPSVGPWGIHLLRNPLLLLPSPSQFYHVRQKVKKVQKK